MRSGASGLHEFSGGDVDGRAQHLARAAVADHLDVHDARAGRSSLDRVSDDARPARAVRSTRRRDGRGREESLSTDGDALGDDIHRPRGHPVGVHVVLVHDVRREPVLPDRLLEVGQGLEHGGGLCGRGDAPLLEELAQVAIGDPGRGDVEVLLTALRRRASSVFVEESLDPRLLVEARPERVAERTAQLIEHHQFSPQPQVERAVLDGLREVCVVVAEHAVETVAVAQGRLHVQRPHVDEHLAQAAPVVGRGLVRVTDLVPQPPERLGARRHDLAGGTAADLEGEVAVGGASPPATAVGGGEVDAVRGLPRAAGRVVAEAVRLVRDLDDAVPESHPAADVDTRQQGSRLGRLEVREHAVADQADERGVGQPLHLGEQLFVGGLTDHEMGDGLPAAHLDVGRAAVDGRHEEHHAVDRGLDDVLARVQGGRRERS